jgi:L-fucose mutarotase
MLKGIDPLLTPDLLKVLAEMGHGDEIVIADVNFTAASLGVGKPVIALPGAGVQRSCAAVLSLLPLDAMVSQPVAFMKVCNTPEGYRSAR